MIQLDCTAPKVALITGAAKRLGAEIARTLHASGISIVVHYHASNSEAQALCDELNQSRPETATMIQADLINTAALSELIEQSAQQWQRLDILVNNASAFYPTPIGTVTEDDWDSLLDVNLKAPFFLSQAAASWLKSTHGCIINIDDIHALRPLKDHPVYSISKTGLRALTLALAKELGPEIRVNGISPGAILWPETTLTAQQKNEIISRTTLRRTGNPIDIARTVDFLAQQADYITGQIITVDGGRTLFS
ncbi:MAG TPA: pteridine reductase [Crenotrichaceae bacterium]|nr:pteridine reductase [Crenotrichaceae bacterium]